MKTVGFIFARGGSKGLPGKNIRPLMGKPLIAWSIEQALSVNRIEKVIVSTDSEEIANVARAYGAEVPFIRPKALSEDNSPEWLAWQHALDFMSKSTGRLPEVMVSIPVTAPLRSSSDINNCLDEYEKGDVDAIITIADSYRSPFFNMVKADKKGYIDLVIKSDTSFTRRQDVPEVFDITTVCYVVNTKFVISNDSLFQGRVKGVKVPRERSIDIDTLFDFEIAEALLTKEVNCGE
jgi:CMP-N-acetylneuraminic acid synthetase